MLHLKLLGGAAIEEDGVPLQGPVAQRHRLGLLALLAMAHPEWSSREKLIALLWPEKDGEAARNLLSQAVHAVRKTLDDKAIVSAGDELRLEPAGVDIDVMEFSEALEAGDVGRAIELYTGPFLDGFFLPEAVGFERWAEGERTRLRQRYLQALERMAEESTSGGDPRAAVDLWRRLAEEEPYSSRVTVRLMETLEATGDRAAAIRRAEAHAELLARELDAEPSPEVSALAARMRREPRSGGVEPGPASVKRRSSGRRGDRGLPSGSPGIFGRRHLPGAVGLTVGLVLVALVGGWFLLGGLPEAGGIASVEADRRIVAVLPFENLTESADAAAFTEGVHADLITALSAVGDLRVISRGSVLPYRDRARARDEIAEELGADILLEGGVQRLGDRVRVNVQLSDPGSGELFWSESYTRQLSVENLFAIQSEITERVTASLEASLASGVRARAVLPPTRDLRAYRYFHRSRLAADGTTRAANEESERLLRLAVQVDPEYADAWAMLAAQYGWRAPYLGVSTSAWDSTMAFAARALELDPDNAAAHTARAVAYGHRGFLDRQEEAARTALRLSPSDDYALRRLAESYRDRGRFLEALRLHREAVRLSPHSLTNRSWVGHVYADLARFETAREWYDDVRLLSPDFFHPLWGLAALHIRTGRPDSAARYAEGMVARYANETVPLTAAAMVFHYLRDFESVERHAGRAVEIAGDAPAKEIHSHLATTLLGFARLRSGDPEGAERLFERSLGFLESWVAAGADTPRWPYEIAAILAARGEVAAALDQLETACELGFRWPWMLERDPVFDALREEPRFGALLTWIGSEVETMRLALGEAGS